MLWTLLLFACSFALAFLLTPLLRQVALSHGWVDQPDDNRKMHKVPIPRIGGLPVLLAYSGALGALLLISPNFSVHHFVWKLVFASLLVFATGLLDDLVGLKPWHKLTGEAVAAVLAYFGGIQIQSLAGFQVPEFLGLPLTMAWLIACTNAFNLIDGLDGLASGIGILAALTTATVGLLHGDPGLVIATAPLAGALAGFLLFNFNPASIFLGDGGSLWVGFMLACYGVIWSAKSVTALSILAPAMLLSIPLLDTTLSICRRFLGCQPIFRADRCHIHHRLLDRGFSPRSAVLMLYAAAAVCACFALLQSATRADVRAIITAAFCGVVWVGIRYLNYQEFAVAVRFLRGTRFMVKSQLCLTRYEKSLVAAQTADDCWRALTTVGREVGFLQIEFRVGELSFQEQLAAPTNGYWLLHVPISDSEYVRFMCRLEFSAVSPIIVPLATVVHRALSPKFVDSRQEATPSAMVKAAVTGQYTLASRA